MALISLSNNKLYVWEMVSFGSVLRGVLVVPGPNPSFNIGFFCLNNTLSMSAHIFSVLCIKGESLYRQIFIFLLKFSCRSVYQIVQNFFDEIHS